MFWGGGIAVIVGVILFAKGFPETNKARRILEITLEKKEVAISEISTQTGFSTEYIRKVISDLMASGYLNGFLEDDFYISAKAKDSIS
jgi:predicted HTH transcriptional regulator